MLNGAISYLVLSRSTSPLTVILLLGLSLASFPGLLAIPAVWAGSVVLAGGFSNLLIDPSRPRLYLTDPGTNSVVIFNTTSNQVISSVIVGSGPAGLDISANRNELYVALSSASGLAVLDLANLVLSRTIQLTANPIDVAAGPQGLAYVTTSEQIGYPRVVDTANNKEIGSITSAGFIYQGLARSSPDHSFLYIGERGLDPASIHKFTATSSPTLVGSAPFASIGDNLQDVSVAPIGPLIYIASGAPYSIQIVNTTDWTSAGGLNTGPYPSSVSLAENGHVAFATHESSDVEQFDTQTFSLVASYSLPEQAGYVRATPDGSQVYVVLSRGLFVIDAKPPVWMVGSSIKATSVGATYVSLTWTAAIDPLGVANYKIFENGNLVATTIGSNLTYTVRGLLTNTTYTFKVEAGNLDSWTTDGPSITVKTLSYAPRWSFIYSPDPAVVNSPATFQVVTTFGPGSIVSYLWDFGDGAHSQGRTVTHTYYSRGSYDVNLTLVDSDGLSNSTEQTIYVGPHPYLPGVTVGTTASYLISISASVETSPVRLLVDATVLSVDRSNVTIRVDARAGRQVVNSTSMTINVATGFESKTILPLILVAANLAVGDPVYPSGTYQQLTIQTDSNALLDGALRATDSIQFSSPRLFEVSWDKQTGLLASLVATVSINSTTYTASYQLVATNAWKGPGIAMLTGLLLMYLFGQARTIGIIAGAVYASLGLLALGIYRSRRGRGRTETYS